MSFPDDSQMWVSHETIYLSLFVQSRGALRKELFQFLRTGRAQRRPLGYTVMNGQGQLRNTVHISERPADANDRAVPGHWEGDLLCGKAGTAIATLVERQTRFAMLVAVPHGHSADVVTDALAAAITKLPAQLRRSLTWDYGKEMAEHARFSVTTGVPVYFCDPRSPWQRGTNENTNGLLRQYFPKRSDLAPFTQDDLDNVAAELNDDLDKHSAGCHHRKHSTNCYVDHLRRSRFCARSLTAPARSKRAAVVILRRRLRCHRSPVCGSFTVMRNSVSLQRTGRRATRRPA